MKNNSGFPDYIPVISGPGQPLIGGPDSFRNLHRHLKPSGVDPEALEVPHHQVQNRLQAIPLVQRTSGHCIAAVAQARFAM